eukprot:30102-Pelagococcus_subviridis.AAC.14
MDELSDFRVRVAQPRRELRQRGEPRVQRKRPGELLQDVRRFLRDAAFFLLLRRERRGRRRGRASSTRPRRGRLVRGRGGSDVEPQRQHPRQGLVHVRVPVTKRRRVPRDDVVDVVQRLFIRLLVLTPALAAAFAVRAAAHRRALLLSLLRVLQEVVEVLRDVEVRLLRVLLVLQDVAVDVQHVRLLSLPRRRAPPREPQHRVRRRLRVRLSQGHVVQRFLDLHDRAVLPPRRPQELRLLDRERHPGARSPVPAPGYDVDGRGLERRSRFEQRELRRAVVPGVPAQLSLREPRVRARVARVQRRVRRSAQREDGLPRRERRGRQVQTRLPVAEEVHPSRAPGRLLAQGRHRAHRFLGLADQVQLHDRRVRASVAPFHRRGRERGDHRVSSRRRRERHPLGVSAVQREEHPADRGFASGAAVRAAKAASRAAAAASRAAVRVEDVEETFEGIPPSEAPRRGGARLRELRPRRRALLNERVRLSFERAEVPEALKASKTTPLRGVERGRRARGLAAAEASVVGGAAVPLRRGLVMRQRLPRPPRVVARPRPRRARRSLSDASARWPPGRPVPRARGASPRGTRRRRRPTRRPRARPIAAPPDSERSSARGDDLQSTEALARGRRTSAPRARAARAGRTRGGRRRSRASAPRVRPRIFP